MLTQRGLPLFAGQLGRTLSGPGRRALPIAGRPHHLLALVVVSVVLAIRAQRLDHLISPRLEFSEVARLAASDDFLGRRPPSVAGKMRSPVAATLQRRRAAETYVAAERSRGAARAAAASLRLAQLCAGGALIAVLATALAVGTWAGPATATEGSPTPIATQGNEATGSPPSTPTGPPLTASATPSSSPTASPTSSPQSGCPTALIDQTVSTIGCVLPFLSVAIEDRTGYDRNLFRFWIDENHNGCNTRQEVLIRDAVVAPFIGTGCTLSQGEWFSQYDGLTFTDTARLDIDHVVPLAEAWDSGANDWDAPKRESYANDLGVDWALLAVSASANRSKADRDPAEWLQIRSEFVCQYLADWLAVKVRWRLSIDELEKATIGANVECAATTLEIFFAPPPP